MALTGVSINWVTRVITVPRNDLTLIQAFPVEIRDLNLNEFRLKLKDLEDDVDGMPHDRTHNHNTEVLLGGIVYARIIEIINGYTVTFEDGQYAVNLIGANSNVGDVVNVNQVSVRSQNSAGLISNQAIEFSSFNGGVTLSINGVSGTIFPTGTPQRPVNNVPDARLIATARGFETIFVKGDYTFDTGDNISNYTVIGENPSKTLLIVLSGSVTDDVQMFNATVTGEFDSTADFNNCNLIDIKYTQGEINNCSLQGTITLANSGQTALIDCDDGITLTDVHPIIDFNGAGNSLAVRNYDGDLALINKTGPEGVEINMATGGHIEIDSTITNGLIRLTGIIEIHDESTSGATIDTSQVIFPDQLQLAAFNEGIHINPISGTTGTKFPIGTVQTPVNNLSDAIEISNLRGINNFNLNGTLVIVNTNLDGYNFYGISPLSATLVLAGTGNSTIKTSFNNLILVGRVNGYVFVENCSLETVSNIGSDVFPTLFNECIIRGDSGGVAALSLNNSVINGENIHFIDCVSGVPGSGTATMNYLGANSPVAFRRYGGGITLSGITGNQDNTFEFNQGQIVIDSTCTSGKVRLGGIYKLTDNGNLIVEERNQSITANISGGTGSCDSDLIATAVWDYLTSSGNTNGSFGLLLNDMVDRAAEVQHTLNVQTEMLKNKPNNC